MSIEEKILNDNSCSPYVDKGRGYVEIAFKDGAYWGYEEGCKTMIEKVEQWLTNSGRGQMIGSLHRFLEEE